MKNSSSHNIALKNFETQTVRDPLFAAEGLDLVNAALALEELEASTEALERVWRKTARWFCFWHPFASTLHPFSFLKSFLNCERERRKFLNFPTPEKAASLLKSYRKCLGELRCDLAAYRESLLAIRRLEAFPKQARIAYFNNEISFDEITQMMELLYKNTQALEEELKARAGLLRGDRPQVSFPENIFLPYQLEGEPLSEENRAGLLLEEKKFTDVSERYGPIFFKLSQFDGEPATHQFFVYVAKRGDYSFNQLEIILADRYYFLDLLEGDYHHFLDRSIYEPLIKRGLPYWHQTSTSFYAVFALDYYPALATVADLEWRRRYLDRSLLMSQQSSLLDLILWNGVHHEKSYARISKVMAGSETPPSLLFTYIVRAYPSLYYLPFNRSVWRLKETPNFAGSRFGKSSYYKTLEEITPKVSPSQLEEIFMGGRIRRQEFDAKLNDSEN